jgi:hypothetical protein
MKLSPMQVAYHDGNERCSTLAPFRRPGTRSARAVGAWGPRLPVARNAQLLRVDHMRRMGVVVGAPMHDARKRFLRAPARTVMSEGCTCNIAAGQLSCMSAIKREPTRDRTSHWVVVLLALVIVFAAADVVAGVTMSVFVNQQGPKAIQVEVSAGRVQPCDSMSDRPIFKGWVEPGKTLALAAPFGCICYRQTYDDFPDVNWSTPKVLCRPACRSPLGPAWMVIDLRSDR